MTADVPPAALYTTIMNVIDIYHASFLRFLQYLQKYAKNKAFSATFAAHICNLSFEQRKSNTEPANRQIQRFAVRQKIRVSATRQI